MMPGITHMPVASMTCASAGTVTVAPTAAILPARMRMVPRSIGVVDAAVRIVAFLMASVRSCAVTGAAVVLVSAMDAVTSSERNGFMGCTSGRAS